ncbi:MAG: hypothetical protein WD652_00200 [Acidimicrobiia bacterium]
MKISNLGITIEAPAGFDVEIFSRPDEKGRYEGGAPAIVHVANFWLPRERSDFGHEVVQNMRLMDVFLAVIEYGPIAAGKRLFAASGVPKLDSESLSQDVVLGATGGQAGVQRFFHVGSRAFGLYAVVGSHRLRSRTVPLLRGILESLEVESV